MVISQPFHRVLMVSAIYNVLYTSSFTLNVYHIHSFNSNLYASSKISNESSNPNQPDYGSTSVDIHQHKLVEKNSIQEKINQWRRPDLYGQSIIQTTIEELNSDVDFQDTLKRIESIGVEGMTKEERTRRRRALDDLGILPFSKYLASSDVMANVVDYVDESNSGSSSPSITLLRKETEVLQINIGLYCNQACGHCHVESSPLRKEMMNLEVAAKCLDLLKNSPSIKTLDITGGAPELNENFRYLVSFARSMRPDLVIIDRCNLTVLQEPGQEDLIPFLVENKVHIVASLPCYSAENVDKQRGHGVFERSISALLALNEAGYGKENTGLVLDLVYNPLGAFLPPPQGNLEKKYKEMLEENFGIVFDSLFTMTNMPVKRFADFLHKRNELKDYMDLLVRNFNPSTLNNLMCRNTVSVGYDGRLFDCDFNQQLGYAIGDKDLLGKGKTVFDINSLNDLSSYHIKNDNHCFGCTAGMGSS